jgi:hypothetical protein
MQPSIVGGRRIRLGNTVCQCSDTLKCLPKGKSIEMYVKWRVSGMSGSNGPITKTGHMLTIKLSNLYFGWELRSPPFAFALLPTRRTVTLKIIPYSRTVLGRGQICYLTTWPFSSYQLQPPQWRKGVLILRRTVSKPAGLRASTLGQDVLLASEWNNESKFSVV